ncbi:MAG: hypothetical protein ACK47B_04140 [Armatimonadota bacterium]
MRVKRWRVPGTCTLLLTAGLLTALAGSPAESGKKERPETFRFFAGRARLQDLGGLYWLALGDRRAYGLFGDLVHEVAFPLAGASTSRGPLRLDALYPVNGRRIGTARGTVKRHRASGQLRAVGRSGRWKAVELRRSTEAMAALAGEWIDLTTRRRNREVRLILDPATSVARVVVTVRGEVSETSGPWMASDDESIAFLPLSGDGTYGGLSPLEEIPVKNVPLVSAYSVRGRKLRLLNPLDREDVLTTLERAPEVPPSE